MTKLQVNINDKKIKISLSYIILLQKVAYVKVYVKFLCFTVFLGIMLAIFLIMQSELNAIPS